MSIGPRDVLEGVGLRSFVKTSGGKGLHLYAPIEPLREGWDELKAYAKAVAYAVVRMNPAKLLATASKAKREGKIFIDYLRNGRGATCVAAYSTRARPGASVSTPLRWEEVTPAVRPDSFGVRNLAERLRGLREDPWAEATRLRQTLDLGTARALKDTRRAA